jgi:hypothetical protein
MLLDLIFITVASSGNIGYGQARRNHAKPRIEGGEFTQQRL